MKLSTQGGSMCIDQKCSRMVFIVYLYLVIGDALGQVVPLDDKQPFPLVETKGNLGYHGSCTVAAKLGRETDRRKKSQKTKL